MLLGNSVLGFPTSSDTNRTEQPQKMARSLKFLCSENKAMISFAVTARSRFSYDAAQMIPSDKARPV